MPLVDVREAMSNTLKYTQHNAQIAVTCKKFKSSTANRLTLKGLVLHYTIDAVMSQQHILK